MKTTKITFIALCALAFAASGAAASGGLRGQTRRLNLLCGIETAAVKVVVGSGVAVTSGIACAGFDAAATAACELVGGGPEDPFADACAIALDAALTAACTEAIAHGGKMTASMVDEKLGCGGRRQLKQNIVQQQTYTCGCICESGPLSMCNVVRECSLEEHVANVAACKASAITPVPTLPVPTLPTLPKVAAASGSRRLNALCWIEKPAVHAIVGTGVAVTSQGMCAGFDVAADAACEAAGGGPEDPFADACAIALDVALTAACEEAIAAGGKMTAAMVDAKLGC